LKLLGRAKRGSKGQLSLELALSFAAYAALVAAFVFAARQTSEAALPKTQLAAGAADARSACFFLEYAVANSRHTLADFPSLEGLQASEGTVARETAAGVARVECRAAARTQNKIAVKQNEKEQV
jgi:uncharacterized protein (UPF0333 family)